MPPTTTSSLPPSIEKSAATSLLAVPVAEHIHNIPAMQKALRRRGGQYLRFRRYNPLAAAVVPLGNTGIYPPAQQLTAVDIDAKMDFYGTYVYLNEQVTLQNQEDVIDEASKRLGVSLRDTEDILTRDMLAASAAAYNATGGGNGDNPTELSLPDILGVSTALRAANGRTFLGNIEGANKFGTAPTRHAFIALGHVNIEPDLNNVAGFISKWNYPNQNTTHFSEYGAVANVRFFTSTLGSISPFSSNLGSDVYNVFVCAREGFASVKQNGYSAEMIYRDRLYDGPLGLNVSLGWTSAMVPRLTNDAWVQKLLCTITT
jgi:N4-gp56 family major capsid protein